MLRAPQWRLFEAPVPCHFGTVSMLRTYKICSSAATWSGCRTVHLHVTYVVLYDTISHWRTSAADSFRRYWSRSPRFKPCRSGPGTACRRTSSHAKYEVRVLHTMRTLIRTVRTSGACKAKGPRDKPRTEVGRTERSADIKLRLGGVSVRERRRKRKCRRWVENDGGGCLEGS